MWLKAAYQAGERKRAEGGKEERGGTEARAPNSGAAGTTVGGGGVGGRRAGRAWGGLSHNLVGYLD